MAGNVESRSRNLVISLCRKDVVHIYLWRNSFSTTMNFLSDNCLNTTTAVLSYCLICAFFLMPLQDTRTVYLLKLNQDKFNKYDLDGNFSRREVDGLMQDIMRLKAKEINKSYKKEEEINLDWKSADRLLHDKERRQLRHCFINSVILWKMMKSRFLLQYFSNLVNRQWCTISKLSKYLCA